MKIKCIIVEDQRPAQKILEHYIEDTPELELTGVFNNALDASAFIKVHDVDLMFLDVHLPKLSGVDFLKILPNPPKVIFTTAFADYALTGFDLNAVDYLLKPFDFSRFYQAVNKLIGNLGTTERADSPTAQKQDFYFAKIDRELVKIHFQDICYIQASGDFVYIHFRDKKLFLSESLKFWEDLLHGKGFNKVHKSYLVNMAAIDKISGNEVHINNQVIPIGRAYRKDFLSRLNQ